LRRTTIIWVVIALGACDRDLDLERLIDQPRFSSYEACDVCPDGTIMMQPPAGTVAREVQLGSPELIRGRTGGAWVEDVPILLSRGVLERGRDRFDTFCAACHGRLGDANSPVAAKMTRVKPADLLAEPYLSYPPGRIFGTITEGYGLMRSYAGQLPVSDRWAVVAYVQALQLAHSVALDELPAAAQTEAQRWLK
jgi:mono/diheme cytochrome c family protein